MNNLIICYLLGKGNNGNKSNDDSGNGPAIAIGTIMLLFSGAAIAGGFITKAQFDNADKNLNNAIKESLNEKGYNLSKVDATYFDWANENDNCFFNFSGAATTVDNKSIDFFAAKYKVNPKLYTETINEIGDKEKAQKLNEFELLKKLSEVVKASELVSSQLNERIAVRGIDNVEEFSDVDKNVILNVSKQEVTGDKVSYLVNYVQVVKSKNGEIGLVNSYVNAEYNKTKELEQNPAKVFLENKEKPTFKIVDRTYAKLEQNEITNVSGKEMV